MIDQTRELPFKNKTAASSPKTPGLLWRSPVVLSGLFFPRPGGAQTKPLLEGGGLKAWVAALTPGERLPHRLLFRLRALSSPVPSRLTLLSALHPPECPTLEVPFPHPPPRTGPSGPDTCWPRWPPAPRPLALTRSPHGTAVTQGRSERRARRPLPRGHLHALRPVPGSQDAAQPLGLAAPRALGSRAGFSPSPRPRPSLGWALCLSSPTPPLETAARLRA